MPATDDLPTLITEARRSAATKEALVKQYLPLVAPIARHFCPSRQDLLDDLVQVGAIGLLHAIDRFDPALGKPFEPYAKSLIAGEMRHYMRDLAPLVRPPRELVEMRPRVLAAQAALAQESDEPVTAEAIAHRTDLPAAKIEEVLALEERGLPMSLDQELESDRGTVRFQLVDGRHKSFQLATEDQVMVSMALSKLRAASREVIEFAYYEDLTQTEIAKKLGISQMQVSRRLKGAMGELWKALNTKLF